MLEQATGDFGLTRLTTARTRGSHHLPPYSILCVSPWHLHSNGFLFRDSQGGVPKLSKFGFSSFCELIIFCSDLRLGWGLKQTCSYRRELSNGVWHFTCTHRGQVDFWLLVVRNQTASLTPDLSFCHNLCCTSSNGSCKPIFDIYVSIAFQWYKKHPNVRCFGPCNQILKFQESRGLPSPHFGSVSLIFTLFQERGCDIKSRVYKF